MKISSLHNLHKVSSMTFTEYHSNSHMKVSIHMLAGSRPKNTGLGKVCGLQGNCNLIKTDKTDFFFFFLVRFSENYN